MTNTSSFQQNKEIKILVLGYDWNNIIEKNPNEMIRRLSRDHLDPTHNTFFLLHVGSNSIEEKIISPRIRAKSIRFFSHHLRPFADLLIGINAIRLIKSGIFVPDVVVASEASLLWWTRVVKVSHVCIYINTLSRDLAQKTRRKMLYLYTVLSEYVLRGVPKMAMVISNDGYEYARAYLHVYPNAIHFFLPNTFDDVYVNENDKVHIREIHAIPHDAFVVVTMSRLEEEKGIIPLVNAFSHLPQHVHLCIVGSGSLHDEILRIVHEMKLDTRVHLIGALPHKEVWGYYKASDMYVQVSSSEALGMSVLEAMYCDVPVAAFPVGGIRDSIGSQNERGIYLDMYALPDSLERAIAFVSNEKVKAKDMAQRAKVYIDSKLETHYSLQHYIS